MSETNPMKTFMWQKLILMLLILATIIVFAQLMKPKPSGETIYLVRHAEKLVGPAVGDNPALSVAGEARAQILAATLEGKGIEYIHSSNYIRTMDTAKPLADELGLNIQIYDPKDLPKLAANIKANPGVHLVVGHSNTIPETVTALGGEGGTPIDETSEYDRLYLVKIDKDGDVSTQLQHYGARYLAD